MRKRFYAIAFLAGMLGGFGSVCAEEVLLGQVAYSRTDLIAEKQDQGTWTFTLERETREVRIVKSVPGSALETENITAWTRVSVLGGVHLKESFVYPITESHPSGRNFGHVEASNSETNEVLYRWPMFCDTVDGIFVHRISCTARMDDGGIYEVTRTFLPRQAMRTLEELRKITAKDGIVTLHIVDKSTQ
jgi:hypothetical protein